MSLSLFAWACIVVLVCIAIVAAAEQEGMQFVLFVCIVAVGGLAQDGLIS